jgi:hypothetical protein
VQFVTIANANGRLALVTSQDGTVVDPSCARSEAPRSIGLSDLERKPLALLHDDAGEMLALVTSTSNALVGPDRVAARVEFLAKLIGTEHARLLALAAFLDERLMAKDIEGAAMIDRALTNCTKRIAMLVREHAASCTVGRRDVVVAVAHANSVHVSPTEK